MSGNKINKGNNGHKGSESSGSESEISLGSGQSEESSQSAKSSQSQSEQTLKKKEPMLAAFEGVKIKEAGNSAERANLEDVMARLLKMDVKSSTAENLPELVKNLGAAFAEAQMLLKDQQEKADVTLEAAGKVDMEDFQKEANSCMDRLQKYAKQLSETTTTLSKPIPPLMMTILNNLRQLTQVALAFKALADFSEGDFNAKGAFSMMEYAGIRMSTLYDLFRLHKSLTSIKPEQQTVQNLAIFLVVTFMISLVIKFAGQYQQKDDVIKINLDGKPKKHTF